MDEFALFVRGKRNVVDCRDSRIGKAMDWLKGEGGLVLLEVGRYKRYDEVGMYVEGRVYCEVYDEAGV